MLRDCREGFETWSPTKVEEQQWHDAIAKQRRELRRRWN